MLVSVMSFPSSSRTYMCEFCVLVFMRVSKLVLFVVMPGCGLPAMVFLRMCCHVSMSVRTS